MDKLEQFIEEKNHRPSTAGLYKSAIHAYEECCGMTLDELLKEADAEEEQGIRWKKRKVKSHLMKYRKGLFESKGEGTANRYLQCVMTVYRHFEIELFTLPSYNSKNVDKAYEKTFEDIPTKQELKDAYYEATNVGECIILLGASSGLSKVDMLKMTVEDLIRAAEKFFELQGISFKREPPLLETLFKLKEFDCVIPVFQGERQKTGSAYTTFASPEFFERTVQYLIGRNAEIKEKYNETIKKANEELNYLFNIQDYYVTHEEIIKFIESYTFNNALNSYELESLNRINSQLTIPTQLEYNHKLFSITPAHLSYSFRKINNKLGLGKVGKTTKFRCHQLRAYHASTLLNVETGAFTESEVDALQGRKKDKTRRAYFTESLSKLYNKYYEAVDSLMLFKEIHGISSETVERLEAENNFYKKEIVKNEQKIGEQEVLIKQILENQKQLEAMLNL